MRTIYDALSDMQIANSESLLPTQPTKLTDKINKLEQRKQDKVNRLGLVGMDDGTTKVDGNTYMNKNKLFNEFNSNAKQELLSKFASEDQWVLGDDGNLRDLQGNIQDPTQAGIWYSGEVAGDKTKMGYVSPYGDITSAEQEVADNYKHFKTQDIANPTLDQNMAAMYGPKNKVMELEAILHGNKDALANRAWELDSIDADRPTKRYTEIYENPNAAGYLGEYSSMEESNLPTIPETSATSAYTPIKTTVMEDIAGGVSRAGNTVATGASMFLQGFGGLADLAAEGGQKLGNMTNIDVLASDGEGIWDDGKLSESADELVGVDSQYMEAAQKNAMEDWLKYKETGDVKYLGSAAWEMFSTPENWGASMGFVFGGGAVGAGAKGLTTVHRANKLRKAAKAKGKEMDMAKAKEIITSADNMMSTTKKTIDRLVHLQPGLVGYSFNDLGEQREEYRRLYKKEMPTGQQHAAFTLNMVTNNLDYFTDIALAKGGGVIKDVVTNAFKNASQEVQKSTVAKLGKAATGLLGDVGAESGVEALDVVGKGYGVDMGHKTLGESVDSRIDDIAVGAIGGAAGAGQFKAVNTVTEQLGKGTKLAKEKYDYNSETLATDQETPVVETPEDIERKANLKTELGEIHAKVTETQDSTDADITRLQEIVSELDTDETVDQGAKDQLKVFAEDVKQHRLKQIDKGELVLGSKEDLVSVLDDIVKDNAELDEVTDNKIFELASKAGILEGKTVEAKKESYKKIKKDFYSVGVEATTGKRGYITYGNELRALTEATVPNKVAITKKVNQLQKFEKSQENYITGLEKLVERVESDINTHNAAIKNKVDLAPPASVTLKKYNNKPMPITGKSEWTFQLAESSDGTIVNNSAKGIKAVIAASRGNIAGIKAELNKSTNRLAELGIDAEATGVSTKPIIDTTGEYKKPLEAVKQDIERVTKNMSDKGSVKYITSLNDEGFTTALTKNDTEKVNSLDYTADDIVYVVFDIPQNAADVKAIRKQFVTNGKLHNTIKAAKEAGATIVMNKNTTYGKKFKDGNKMISVNSIVIPNITKYAGGRYQSIGTSEGTARSRRIFKSKETVQANAAKQKEIKAKKKLHNDRLDKLYEHYETNSEATSELEEIRVEVLKEFETEAKYESYIKTRLNKRMVEALKELKEIAKLDETEDDKAGAEDAWGAKYGEVVQDAAKKQYGNYTSRKEDNKGYIELIKDLKKELADLTVEEDIIGVQTQIEELIEKLSSDDPRTLAEKILEASSSKGMESIHVSSKGEPTRSESTVGKIKSAHKKRAESKELGETNKKWINHKQQPLDVNSYVTTDKDPNILTILEPEMLLGEEHKDYHRGMLEWLKGSQKLGTTETDKSFSQADLDMKDSPALGLVLDTTGNVNETVALAMQLAVDEVITFNGSALNPEFKSKDDAARMLGVLETQLTNEMYAFLKDKGSFNKTVAYDIGKAIAAKLGLKYNKEAKQVEKEAFDKLLADLGNMAIMGAESQKQLTTSEVLASEFTKAKDAMRIEESYADGTNEKATIWFVQTPKKKKGDETDPTAEYKEIHEAIDEASVFEKMYHTEPIKNPRFEKEGVAKDIVGLQIPSKGKNSPLKFLKKLVAMPWQPDETGIADVVNMGRDVLRKYQGYKTEDQLSKMTIDGRAAAESKNREIEKSISELEKLGTEAAKTEDRFTMYFDWFYSGNGRYMMDSNTISPQTDKLHRFIVQPISHMKKYMVEKGKVKLGKKDVTKQMNYALAQAFGYAVDKKSNEKIQLVGDTLRELTSEQLTELDTMVKTGDTKKLENFLPSMMSKKQLEVLGKDTKLEVEHISHTLQGLRTLEGLATGKVTTALTAEFDAVTSGFGLKLLQLPILRDMWKWLNKVGVFRKGDMKDTTSMNDWLDTEGNLDSYQALGEEADVKTMDTEFNTDPNNPSNKKYIEKHLAKKKQLWSVMSDQKLLKELDADGSVSKALRTLFKDPFMTFNYSAGIKSIKESLANKLTNEVLEGIAQEDSKYDKLKDKIAKMSGRSPEELVTDLRTNPLSSIRVGRGKFTKAIDVLLVEMYTTTYGAKVEHIMTKHFSEFMEANDTINGAFRVMFDVFSTKYQEAVSKIPVGDMNDDKKMEILYGKDSKDGDVMPDGLLKQFPLIKGPFSKAVQEGIGIYTTKSQTLDDDTTRYMPAATKTGIDKKGERTKKVRHPIRDFEAAVSAGSVVPIHYIDGGLMAQLLEFDFTAIHDAVMPELDKSDDIVKTYNEAMIKVNSQYKVVVAIQDMLKSITKDEADKTKISIRVWKDGESEWTNTDKSTVRNGEIIARIDELVERVKKGAKEIEEQVYKVGHMAGMEDGMWTNPANEVQEEAKPEEDTINDKEKLLDVLGSITTKAGKVTPHVAKIIKLIEDC